eukprot:6913314-Pyramimonas_sp.AAC.1
MVVYITGLIILLLARLDNLTIVAIALGIAHATLPRCFVDKPIHWCNTWNDFPMLVDFVY